jgi:hypothetical protein
MSKAKEAYEQWLGGLKDQGKLTDEQLESLKSALTPESVDYIGSSVLRQEDYSRLAAQVKQKEREVADFQASLSEWKGNAESEFLAMQRAKATAEAEIARLKTLAAAYEVPEDELRKGTPTVEDPNKNAQPAQDMSEFMKTKDAQQAMIDALKVQNKLISIASKHQVLFGNPLDDEALVDRAIQSGRTIDQEWEETYKVADKRAEITAAAQAAHDQRIREEERAKVLSELKLPEARPGAPTSPVSDMFKSSIDTANDHVSGLQAALEAYGTGKYRPSGS